MDQLVKLPCSGTRSLAMGPLEFRVYSETWRASYRHRRDRARELQDLSLDLCCPPPDAPSASILRHAVPKALTCPVFTDAPVYPSHETAVRLAFARLFDQRPDLVTAIQASAPVIIIDVPDETANYVLIECWRKVLFAAGARVVKSDDLPIRKIDGFAGVVFSRSEPRRGSDARKDDREALHALQMRLPVFGISPSAVSHLPPALLANVSAHLTLNPTDNETIIKTIRVCTGRRYRGETLIEEMPYVELRDVSTAVKPDFAPAECVTKLQALSSKNAPSLSISGQPSLDELHGMPEAIQWARSTLHDLDGWRKGKLEWSEVQHAVVLDGPTGTGKTTFAKVFSTAARLPLIATSFAKWQGSGDGHLGHFLRAMKKDFEKARAAACIFLCDEIDSFPNRNSLRGNNAPYYTQVVNGLIAELDGAAGREGIIFIGTTNDVSRCDPAILRSGRMDRVVPISLPDPETLEQMYRVRLKGDLNGRDLKEVALLSIGFSGADVERTVKDARRRARCSDRHLVLDDLTATLEDGNDEHSEDEMFRLTLHEAAHALSAVLLNGHEGVFAMVSKRGNRLGTTWQLHSPNRFCTHADLQKRLDVLLAGRVAEELFLGAASFGSAGVIGSDLAEATRLAAAAIGSFGFEGPHPLVFLSQHNEAGQILGDRYLRDAVQHELEQSKNRVEMCLKVHERPLREIANLLRSRRCVSGADIREILSRANPVLA